MLRVLTELSGRRGVEMTPILPELVEVVLVCVDRTRLRERGLYAVFPIFQRCVSFNSLEWWFFFLLGIGPNCFEFRFNFDKNLTFGNP